MTRPIAARRSGNWCKLPYDFSGEAALQLRPAFSGIDLSLDARRVRYFDAVGAATLANWRLRMEGQGGRLSILEPVDPSVRRELRHALGSVSGGGESVVLDARPVATEFDVKAVAAALGARIRDRVPEAVATTAVVATSALADNAATHAPDRFAVAAATLRGDGLSICVRDCGDDATPEDAHLQLIERIQLPLASGAADWGTSAGVAWIAHLIARYGLDAELIFASGTGRLHVPGTAPFCGRGPAIEGFAAIAKFVV